MKIMIARAAVVGALLVAGTASAQTWSTYKPRQSLYILNYEMSEAIGSFSDNYISSTSWRGLSFEGRSFVKPNVSAGISFGYNRFDQTKDTVFLTTSSGGTISGPVYRYADQLAIKALLHAYMKEGPIQPYLGVGIGGVWNYAYSQTADLSSSDNGFDFIVSPEIGLTLTGAKGASSVGLNVAFRYNYTTADFRDVNDAQSLAIAVGIFGGY